LNKSRIDLEDQSNILNVELSQLRKEQSDMKTDVQRHKSRRTTLEAKISEIAEKTAETEQLSADVRALGAAFDKILTKSKAVRQSLLELKLALQKLVEQVQEQEAPAVASQRRLNRAGTTVAPVAVMDRLRGIRPALDSLMASAGEISQNRLLAPS
jgi:chromosome segregation ATPase